MTYIPHKKKMDEHALARLWRSPLPLKLIAHELGVSINTVVRWRRKLNLPSRKGKRMVFSTFRLSPELYEAARQRAKDRNFRSFAAYVRHLITLDIQKEL